MGTLLGFRRPQFSEDVAWLPDWLRQHDSDSIDKHPKGQTHSEEQDEAWPILQQGSNLEKDVNMLSRDDCKYQLCHLLLSGEDNSPVSFAPSLEHVVRFHLQLSLDDNSQNMSSPLNTSQAERRRVNDVFSLQQAQTSAHCEERENLMDDNAIMENFTLSTPQCRASAQIVSSSPANNEDTGINHEEHMRDFKDPDVSDAVELSIAASEALIIHEIVNSDPSTKYFPAEAVLEVALKVKQSRLEGLKQTYHCPTADKDETDSLSDLDVADAYEDVGLSVSCSESLRASDSIISQVKDTPISEIYLGCNENKTYEGCVATSSKQGLRDVLNSDTQRSVVLALKYSDGEKEKILINNSALGTSPSLPVHANEYVLQGSVAADSDCPAATERVDFAMIDISSFQSQKNVNISPRVFTSKASENPEKLLNVIEERFQSRWLGGWTLKKEVNTSAVKKDNAKSIHKYLVGETSYLSESADIAPDENSCVQKQDKGVHMASQSSIPFEGLCNEVNDGVMTSQDVLGSSSLSLVDPLCSVVPCSLSPEDVCSSLGQHLNEKIAAFSPAPEYGLENLQRTSNHNVKIVDEELQAVPMGKDECSYHVVRRRLTSLHTYSKGRNCDAFVERESVLCENSELMEFNSRLPEKNLGYNSGCIGSPPPKSMFKCTVGEIGKNYETFAQSHPVTDLANEKQNNDKSAEDRAELLVNAQQDRRPPLILNRMTCRRFQASRYVAHNLSTEENPKQSAVPETDILFPHGRNFQLGQSETKMSIGTEVPPRKRVRFSESRTDLLQKNNPHKFQCTQKNGSTARASKRLKCSNARSESTAQPVKRRRNNFPSKDGKRRIFCDVEFLLTGFSSQKKNELEGLIRKYGGMVLSDIPCPSKSRGKRGSRFSYQQLPVVLSLKKLETTEFLYGCAVNACMLKVNWLTDSIAAASVLPPEKYMILPNHTGGECARIGRPQRLINFKYIFDGVGVMLHGKHSFSTKLAKVVKHGGGQVFRTLQWLVRSLDAQKISIGVIVAENEGSASRHLKHCAAEQKIPMMPASWMINSLHEGKLLPFTKNNRFSLLPPSRVSVSVDWSEEI